MTEDVEVRPPQPSTANRVLGVVGELSMTVGVVLLLFVAYQLWWTNVSADHAAQGAATELQEQWASDQPTDSSSPPESTPARPELGSAFALTYIPRLRASVWGLPINEGVDLASLARGLGHYPETAKPGKVGNFAVAGHRATNGEPLRDIDQLQAGDQVIIETATDFGVYTLDHDQIVAPSDVWVIEPVPGQPGATPTEKLITVTTCNPRWASNERWIWWGRLSDRVDKSTGELPKALEVS
jgi:sortase A